MNKKGMTLVEIIVAISLISVVMVFLFQVLITVVNGNKRNDTKSKTLISKAIVMKAVEHDLDTFGLSDNSGVIDCSNKIENYLTLDSGSINQIIPASARAEDYYCVKLTYNEINVKYNEGYLLFYQNNNKGFLAYKRGKGNVLETQIVREIDAIPQILESNKKISTQNEGNLYSLRINFPIIATDGNNYDLTINYINSGNLDYPIPTPEEPITPTEKVTITIDVNGGMYDGQTNNVTIETQIGNEVQLSIPTKEGYTFKEWTIISGEADINENKITPKTNLVKLSATYEESVICGEFASDPWETIAECVRNRSGDSAPYNVGDEKEVEIDMNNDGLKESYTVRIANNSNYNCSLDSKTACGFVVEFVDIIEKRAMNSSDTNVGGWPATAINKYLNGDTENHLTYNDINNSPTATLYSKLPSNLKSAIVDTTVVSGHGSTSGETNFTSTDKLYLLSTKEVWVDGTSNLVSSYETAYSTTRQLDYYEGKGVTTNNYGEAIKKYNGTAAWWWLRTAYSNAASTFLDVASSGIWGGYMATHTSGGLAPAFRIG